eukprot:CAMPEP_0177706962 /NCGR_PEP_ID=MMETSP0484_2-20121128/9500_1 /TAXON_ID=354590 /ORGANISM="Rhodomonas lens, Strain RHODO" /LENGTH=309 /DNA_ID=CAMNT_0019218449 /DNA_START=71 /DNA_END=996 /DNA_ORIENTATION=-
MEEGGEQKPNTGGGGGGPGSDKGGGGGSNPPHRFSVENQRAYRERITALHERLDKLVPKPRNIKRRKKRSRIHLLEDLRVLLQSLYSDDKMLPLLQGAVARQKGEAPAVPGEAAQPLPPSFQIPGNRDNNNSFSSITQRMLLSQGAQFQGMQDQHFASGMAALQNSMQASGGLHNLPANMQHQMQQMGMDFSASLPTLPAQQAIPQQLQAVYGGSMAQYTGMERIPAFDPSAGMPMNIAQMDQMTMKSLMGGGGPAGKQQQSYNPMPQYAPAVAVRLGGQQPEHEIVSNDPNLMVSSTSLGQPTGGGGG